jgi:hypothetical protein
MVKPQTYFLGTSILQYCPWKVMPVIPPLVGDLAIRLIYNGCTKRWCVGKSINITRHRY